jgi:hypothetical protein
MVYMLCAHKNTGNSIFLGTRNFQLRDKRITQTHTCVKTSYYLVILYKFLYGPTVPPPRGPETPRSRGF